MAKETAMQLFETQHLYSVWNADVSTTDLSHKKQPQTLEANKKVAAEEGAVAAAVVE